MIMKSNNEINENNNKIIIWNENVMKIIIILMCEIWNNEIMIIMK